jgi:EmrB/QacA subfamily drug resistance transporter
MTATDEIHAPAAARFGPIVQYALLAGPLLSMLDSSIVNVAIAPIAREMNTSLSAVQWAVSGYLLALGTGLAATPYLARRFGTLPLYSASMAAFTLASASCAAAPNVSALIASRVVQGLVAAPMVPLSMRMTLGSGGARRSMSNTAGVLLFLGPALGPTVGGALIGAGGWRSIFLINLPLGLAAALCARAIPGRLAPGRIPGTRLDLPGLGLLGGGLTLVLLAATEGGNQGWNSAACWTPLAIGAGLLAGYAGWSVRAEHPALDLSLVRRAVPALSLTLCALASVVTFAVVFLLPVFVQEVQRRSALATGLAMAPQGVITGLSMMLVQGLLKRISVRTTVLAGFALLAGASLGLLAIGTGTPLYLTAALLAARAASIGLVISPLLVLVTDPLDGGDLGDANTLFNIWQRIAGSFGVGLISALYASHARSAGPVAALHLTGAVVAGISAAGVLGAVFLPAVRNKGLAGQ